MNLIKNEFKEIVDGKQLKSFPEIIAVTKTFDFDKITPLINDGHIHFGENKEQEAEEKWAEVKKINNKIKLHMVGTLQSNKVKKAVQIFDYIHSLDNIKLAKKIVNQFGHADLITINNLFANIDELEEFMKSIELLLGRDGVLIIESSYLLDMINNMIFDYIYHEHLSYFSILPLRKNFKL